MVVERFFLPLHSAEDKEQRRDATSERRRKGLGKIAWAEVKTSALFIMIKKYQSPLAIWNRSYEYMQKKYQIPIS